MLTSIEKAQLKALVQSPQWGVMELLAKKMIEKIRDDSVVGITEWDTLRATLLNEGQTRGIRSFIQEVYNNVER